MATTTSSASSNLLNSSRLTQRRANAASNWKAPGDYTPKGLISSRWGPPMTDDTLLTLARANAKLDLIILTLVKQISEVMLEGHLNAGDITAQVESRHDVADIATIESQFGAIERGESTFTDLYLVNRHLLYYWEKALSFVMQFLDAGKDDSTYESMCNFIENVLRRADALSIEIIAVAENGLLKPEVRTILGEKWDKVDQLCDYYYSYGHGKAPRTLSTWSALSKRIDRLAKNAPPIQSVTDQSTGSWTTTSLLWLTFGGTVLANIPTFALAYGYSEHKPGTVKDADFWFLMQASISQGFGLTTACLPLWKASNVPKWSWMPPMTIALLCVLLAPPLYVVAPTEWSSFLTLIATAVQSFSALQFALIGSPKVSRKSA